MGGTGKQLHAGHVLLGLAVQSEQQSEQAPDTAEAKAQSHPR